MAIESLEPRRLLSGNVSAHIHDGILHIRGDASANAIRISAVQPASKRLRISGDATTINVGSAALEFAQVRQIRINLGAGDNSISLDGVERAHRLDIRTGGGDDTILMNSCAIDGRMLIEMHRGDDTLNMVGSSVSHATSINTSDGDDVITFSRAGFGGRFLLEAGEGNDTIFNDASFPAQRRILGGARRDRIGKSAISLRSIFYDSPDGWRAGFADYQTGREIQHDMTSTFIAGPENPATETSFYLRSKPIDGEAIFAYLTRRMDQSDGLRPNTTYQVRFLVNMAIDNNSFCLGSAQGPERSVYLKAGATAKRLTTVSKDGIERLNVDHGTLSGGGKEIALVEGLIDEGRCALIGKDSPIPPQPVILPEPVQIIPVTGSDDVGVTYLSLQSAYIHTSLVRTDSRGRLSLIVGTASGYPGLTQIKYYNIQVKLIPIASKNPQI